MLYLMTGLPGHGKTLNTLKYISENPDFKNRQVYYNGIPELTIEGWEEFEDAEKWYDLPDGSICVIDESQRIFPTRKIGSDVPRKVSEFETHRHRGVDIFLITQHPTLIDAHVRKLVGKHIHVFRPFNGGRVTMYQWDQVCDPKNYHDKKQSDSKVIKLDKKFYGKYKSTVLNTHKLRIPRKLILLPIALGILGFSVFSVFSFLDSDHSGTQSVPAQPQAQSTIGNSHVPADSVAKSPYSNDLSDEDLQRKKDIELYYSEYDNKPRVKTEPQSSPIYDSLFEVRSKPDVHCIVNNKMKCICYDQQLIKYQFTYAECKSVIAGRFDPTRPDPDYSLDDRDRFESFDNSSNNSGRLKSSEPSQISFL